MSWRLIRLNEILWVYIWYFKIPQCEYMEHGLRAINFPVHKRISPQAICYIFCDRPLHWHLRDMFSSLWYGWHAYYITPDWKFISWNPFLTPASARVRIILFQRHFMSNKPSPIKIFGSVSTSQRTNDIIITALLRQNDVAKSFWCNSDRYYVLC